LDLYLHIGMNKSASTAIQDFFSTNRDRLLAEHSVLWPRTGLGHGGRGGNSHYAISEALGFTNDPRFFTLDKARIGTLITDLRSEFSAARPRVAVLSSEFFVLRRDPERVKLFFGRHNPRIVIYLRRHDAWLESLFAQAIKSVPDPKWDSNFESFLSFQKKSRNQHLSYLELVNAWAKVFGDDRIELRPYREESPPSAVIADFLSLLGVEKSHGLRFPTMPSNASPSANTLSIVDRLQRSGLPDRERNRLLARVLELDNGRFPAFAMDPRTRAAVLADNLADYGVLSERFLGGRALFAPVPVDPDPQEGHSPLPLSVLTHEVSRVLSAVLGKDEVARLFG
jgi:hypothetical protein